MSSACTNIIKIISVGHAGKPGSTAISMEFAAAGDAFKDITAAGPQGYADSSRLHHVASAIARAAAHCHANGVAHRDIKPENILLFESPASNAPPVPKLCDFGAAAIAPRSAMRSDGMTGAPVPLLSRRTVGSSQYCAPEIMSIHFKRRARESSDLSDSGRNKTSAASGRASEAAASASSEYNAYATDVWSWAVTVYVLATRKVPFKHAHVSDYRFRSFLASTQAYVLSDSAADCSHLPALTAREATYVWKWPEHFSPELVELLSACMRFRAEERPSMAWVLQHRWVQTPVPQQQDTAVAAAHSPSAALRAWMTPAPEDSAAVGSGFAGFTSRDVVAQNSSSVVRLPPLSTALTPCSADLRGGSTHSLCTPGSQAQATGFGVPSVSHTAASSSVVSRASSHSAALTDANSASSPSSGQAHRTALSNVSRGGRILQQLERRAELPPVTLASAGRLSPAAGSPGGV